MATHELEFETRSRMSPTELRAWFQQNGAA
jgi:hypothetical protein